jgi:hypothetical protein
LRIVDCGLNTVNRQSAIINPQFYLGWYRGSTRSRPQPGRGAFLFRISDW